MQLTVVKKTEEAADIFSFEFACPLGVELPSFTAGAHIDVHVRPGLVRQYSLCNDPAERHRYVIAVLCDAHSRGGARTLHSELHEGDTVTVGEPRNHFPLVPAARSLLIGGGIGITPLLGMAEWLNHGHGDYRMHYCTRSEASAAFVGRLREPAFAGRVQCHFDDGPPAQQMALPALLAEPDPDLHLYVCGPAGFIDYVIDCARDHGWPAANIHREYFSNQDLDTSNDGSFEIRIASSGAVLPVAADESVSSVLVRHGFAIPVSCEQGVCGTCLTGILSGEPDHRDLCLSDEERARNDQFTPCCSRAKGKLLVLDL
ncbi:vanillate O-demethylase ferredoxin subunit [Pseudoduganella lurida]|uniref:Vanillate O-demethylase ferredoxin subunit n=1 Tax=Pseudoduganella lurida TaxID=1036180 RepID=A0A562RDW3_9BURK|nr:PDR/VanB family oxidoreductase [Pseudoduganella lurida]TWI66580.1 vanillate O-demethylase ferredoxin subunit [Pseudoduganella lurida]